MNFNEKIKNYYNAFSLLEQDAASALPGETDAAMPPAQAVAQPASQDQAATPLSSEGEAMLVRLLKKALVIKPDTADTDTIVELPDINPTNAKTVLQQLVTLIRKYDPDVDINK